MVSHAVFWWCRMWQFGGVSVVISRDFRLFHNVSHYLFHPFTCFPILSHCLARFRIFLIIMTGLSGSCCFALFCIIWHCCALYCTISHLGRIVAHYFTLFSFISHYSHDPALFLRISHYFTVFRTNFHCFVLFRSISHCFKDSVLFRIIAYRFTLSRYMASYFTLFHVFVHCFAPFHII